jgi:formyltetrahydrofolate deformylase
MEAVPAVPGPTAILLLSCPDQRGLVAAVSDFVYRHAGNIVHAEQHIDSENSIFFQRIEFELDQFDLGRDEIEPAFAPIVGRFGMQCQLRFSDEAHRLAILVSQQPHCLFDLLARWQRGDLAADIPIVISNHSDHADAVRFMGPVFEHLPVTPETRPEQERAILGLLDANGVDLVVLARYMQVLSDGFVARFPNRIINIHHSFLPAFLGGRPYHRAHDRGVKLVGATAHYATAELDEGPIIAQDVVAVTHRDSVDDLIRKGRDVEAAVLARAVRAHLESRILVYGRKTVVFD